MTDRSRRSKVAGWLIFLLLSSGVWGITHVWVLLSTPFLPDAEPKIVEIPRGTAISQISQLLSRQGIIPSSRLFSLLVWITGKGGKLKSGEYLLNASMSSREALEQLEKGVVVSHRVTIPEGSTVRQIAKFLAQAGLINKEVFLEATLDRQLLEELSIPIPNIEGYLFPDTYYFAKGLSPKEIIHTMAAEMQTNFVPEHIAQMERIGYTTHQILTLASLIEKEGALPDERQIISAVYHNRLRKRRLLQCDPTVIYALGEDFDGNLKRKHLRLDSPYNTYRYRGLPPGPIASPGREAILAALYPAKVNYFYFVSKNDGSHQFSATLKEHNNAVVKYQKRRSGRKRR